MGSVAEIKFDEDNQRDNDDLMIGFKTRDFLKTKIELNKMNDAAQKIFFDTIRNFYTRASKYLIKKLPFDNELLKKAEIVDLATQRDESSPKNLRYFLNRFPCLLGAGE